MLRFAIGGAVVVAGGVASSLLPQPATSSRHAAVAARATRLTSGSAIEPALEQVGRRDGVLGRLAAGLLRERRREALVGRLDRHLHDRAKRGDEQLGLVGLLAVLAAQRERQADDDALRLVLADEPRDLREAGLVAAFRTTQTGRARVPLASETATPVRAEP